MGNVLLRWAAYCLGVSVVSLGWAADPEYGRQTALQQANPEAAWERARGAGVVVALLDTGVDSSHPDLRANLLPAVDFVDDQPLDPGSNGDPNGHGTHLAGVIAALKDNDIGISGIAPEARVLPVRVLKSTLLNGIHNHCTEYTDATNTTCKTTEPMLSPIKGMQYAADYAKTHNQIVVVNASLGSVAQNNYCSAIEALFNQDPGLKDRLIIVAAAMNRNTSDEYYPAACSHSNVVAVAAVDGEDQRWRVNDSYGSNYGNWITLAAPGAQVFSTKPDNEYGYLSGTSQATAFVSGALAVILSADTDLKPVDALGILLSNLKSLSDSSLGGGRLDLSRAMSAVPEQPQITPPSAPASLEVIME